MCFWWFTGTKEQRSLRSHFRSKRESKRSKIEVYEESQRGILTHRGAAIIRAAPWDSSAAPENPVTDGGRSHSGARRDEYWERRDRPRHMTVAARWVRFGKLITRFWLNLGHWISLSGPDDSENRLETYKSYFCNLERHLLFSFYFAEVVWLLRELFGETEIKVPSSSISFIVLFTVPIPVL